MATATTRKKATKRKKAAAPKPEPPMPLTPRDVVHKAMEPILTTIGEKVAAQIKTTLATMPSTKLTIETYKKRQHNRGPGCVEAEITLGSNITLGIMVTFDYMHDRSKWLDQPYEGKEVSKSRFLSDQHLAIGEMVIQRFDIVSEVSFSMSMGRHGSAETLTHANRIAKVSRLGLELERFIEESLSPHTVGEVMVDALGEALRENGQTKELATHKKSYKAKN